MEQTYTGRATCLRPLEDDDLDTIAALYRATPNYSAALSYGQAALTTLRLQTDLDDAREHDSRYLFAVERCADGPVIGMADVQLESTMSNAATIALLLIGGPYQGQGYGSEAADLLETALFAEPGVDLIMAGVDEASELGIRFWQGRGYSMSGLTTHDPATSRRTVWLAKKWGSELQRREEGSAA
jgi:RimJ/RimL family protein N-acetyltransferase